VSATRGGLTRFRPVGPGSGIALVAPASPFVRADFDAGCRELERLGFRPVYDDRVFEREDIVAGPPESRARQLADAISNPAVDGVLAVRGGYGSVETLPELEPAAWRSRRTACIGYSDITSLHTFLTCHVGLTSVHGPMIEGRLAVGPSAYDPDSFLAACSAAPMGELTPEGVEVLNAGETTGPLFGGTLTQLAASLGTPYAFTPPQGHVLLLEDIGERPYRLRRMLTQLRLAGVLSRAAAIVIGQLPKCDEPDRPGSARAACAAVLRDFAGPVVFGFPTGHTTTPLVSLPLGVECRVIARGRPALVFTEAAAV
jgi:muramoyltetrapeptide carboxypeptidase